MYAHQAGAIACCISSSPAAEDFALEMHHPAKLLTQNRSKDVLVPTIWASAARGPTAAFVVYSLPAGFMDCFLNLKMFSPPSAKLNERHVLDYKLIKAPIFHKLLKVILRSTRMLA